MASNTSRSRASQRGEVLFELPIAGIDSHEGGKVVVTKPAKGVYLVAWSSGADNRLIKVCFTVLA